MCCSAYEIWKTREVTHEGTNQVKKTKISMLAHNKIDANESLNDEKVANFCFMAHGDKEDEVMAQGNKEDEEDEVILESPSYDELFKVFEDMQFDLEKLGSKYVILQKKYEASIIKNKSLLNEISYLKENNHNVVKFDTPQISCLRENNHNIVKFDIPCKKHAFDSDEKNCIN